MKTKPPIAAILDRRNELKDEYGRTYEEANRALMLELTALDLDL